jgi:hypothetical protein
LNMIFTGKAGGFMRLFANIIGEVRGIEYAPIKFEVAEDLAYWNVRIPGKVIAKAEALTGPGEQQYQTKWTPQMFASNGREVADPVSMFRLIGPVHESDSPQPYCK